MSGITTRKSYTKIKNFTEKDQVRVKYSHIGKDKKLMLSVYIGEDVYNQLTEGKEYKRLITTYIPGDMLVVAPTNDEKEGLIHRYNGRGRFKTTCIRISLGKLKDLKLSKSDFTNRVVEYNMVYGGIDEPSNALRINISNSKKIKFTVGSSMSKNKKINSDHPFFVKEKEKGEPEKERYSSQTFSPCGKVYGPNIAKQEIANHPFLAKQKIEGEPIPYIPFNDLDEIQEKIIGVLKNQEALAESMSFAIELLNTVLIKGKEESESPDNNRRIAMLEARFYRLELALEEKNKSVFERIFGKD